MIRQWYSMQILPVPGKKVYYFSKNLGIFRGKYYYDTETMGNPHKFCSNYGIVDADDISHWMPYLREDKNRIPLPPDYTKSNLINETVDIPEGHRQLVFSYEIIGDV